MSILFKDTNKKAKLQSCLFVPEFDINLISVNLLTEKGYKIIFDTKCKIINSKNDIISTTINNNELYTFPIVNSNANAKYAYSSKIDSSDNFNIWHQRMGHINEKSLEELNILKSNNSNKFICEPCILAKAKRHINHNISSNKCTKYLELVQSDLFEPTQTSSFSNKKYFITFLDKFSKWLEIECLSFKNDAFKAFERYLIKEERNSSKKLKTLRTDNGTEFFEIYNFCSTKGIKSEKTAPYAHEQAGAAERINLTLLNKIRALFFTAKLSIKFWAEALYAVVYLYNQTPHASLNYKSPYEIKYGKNQT